MMHASKKRSTRADWGCIPQELVGVIANKFSTIEDYAAFAAVCRSYRFATKGEQWRPVDVSRQPPWLLLCCQDEDDVGGGCTQRGLLSMYRNRNKFLMNLPELHDRYCWGTPYGWIVTLGLDNKLHLFNPLNRRRIALTDQYMDPELWDDKDMLLDYVGRATLIKKSTPSSSSSNDDDFIVVNVGSAGFLQVMRANTWEDVKFVGSNGDIKGVIGYQGQIYAVCHRGMLLICSNFDDDATHPPTVDYFVPYDERFEGDYSTEQYYAVESLGELLLVVRYADQIDGNDHYSVSSFEVFKLNFETKEWIQIYDLGDCALFVGGCQTMSLSQPERYNCRSNCIYFTDDGYLLFYPKKEERTWAYMISKKELLSVSTKARTLFPPSLLQLGSFQPSLNLKLEVLDL